MDSSWVLTFWKEKYPEIINYTSFKGKKSLVISLRVIIRWQCEDMEPIYCVRPNNFIQIQIKFLFLHSVWFFKQLFLSWCLIGNIQLLIFQVFGISQKNKIDDVEVYNSKIQYRRSLPGSSIGMTSAPHRPTGVAAIMVKSPPCEILKSNTSE